MLPGRFVNSEILQAKKILTKTLNEKKVFDKMAELVHVN